MRTLSRYLLREFLSASTATSLVFLITWTAGDVLVHIDELGSGALWALARTLSRALDVLPLIVPMACAVGVVWSLTQAVRTREITAIRCGGIPLRTALLPIVAASLLIALGLGLFQDRVAIPARRAQAGTAADAAEGPEPVQKNGTWWFADRSGVFAARDYDAAERALLEVTYFEYGRDRGLARRIDAARALHASGHVWELHGVRVYDFTSGGVAFRAHDRLLLALGLTETDLARAERPLAHESLNGLAKRIREQQSVGRSAGPLEAAFHERLAQPLAVLVLVLLAIPFAIGDVERGDSLPRAMLASLVAAAVFWGAWSLAVLGARSEALPAAPAIWTVVAGALGIALWQFRAVRE